MIEYKKYTIDGIYGFIRNCRYAIHAISKIIAKLWYFPARKYILIKLNKKYNLLNVTWKLMKEVCLSIIRPQNHLHQLPHRQRSRIFQNSKFRQLAC